MTINDNYLKLIELQLKYINNLTIFLIILIIVFICFVSVSLCFFQKEQVLIIFISMFVT